MKWDYHNNQMPMAVLILISGLNIGLVLSFIANIGGPELGLNGMQIYALAAVELVGVIIAYVVCKRRSAAVPF